MQSLEFSIGDEKLPVSQSRIPDRSTMFGNFITTNLNRIPICHTSRDDKEESAIIELSNFGYESHSVHNNKKTHCVIMYERHSRHSSTHMAINIEEHDRDFQTLFLSRLVSSLPTISAIKTPRSKIFHKNSHRPTRPILLNFEVETH